MTTSPDASGTASPLPGAGRNESLLRAFEILRAIAGHAEGASVAELAVDTGLPRSTVTRMLASLFDIGAVVRPGSARRWAIGPAILDLASSASPLSRLQERGAEMLQRITAELDETSMLAIPTGRATVWVVEEARSSKLLGMTGSWVGRTVSSSTSGFVRILLAELPRKEVDALLERLVRAEFEDDSAGKAPTDAQIAERVSALHEKLQVIRDSDYSIVIDELEEGLAGIGYPVRVKGTIVAMFAVYMPSSRFNVKMQRQILEVLERASSQLAQFLAHEGGEAIRERVPD